MLRNLFVVMLAGATIFPTAIAAQTPTPAPAATPAGAATTGEGSTSFPTPLTVEGQPIESRPPEKSDDKPLFAGQTRAPYHKGPDYKLTLISDKLHLPWSIAFLPDGKFLLTEKELPAAMRIVDKDGTISAPLNGLEPLAAPGKLGLLDVVLDPDFAKNKRVFFTFFERQAKGYSNTFVARATLDEAAATLHDVTVIFRATPTDGLDNFSAKQGGRIAIGKDGNLFITIGDRDRDTPWQVAQQLDNDLGKIIHITPDGAPASDNPFLQTPGAKPEIWVYGTRSQEGLAFDPKTNKLWETEHGPRGGDELNLIQKGKNYGWPVITHGLDYPGTPVGEGIVAKAGMEQPVYYWDPVIAPSGLAFYHGNLFPQWKDSVFVGALRGQMLDRLTLKNDKVVSEEAMLVDLKSRIRDVRTGPDGAVYITTENPSGNSAFYRITPK
jgi:aldose sugar dehydrogenase